MATDVVEMMDYCMSSGDTFTERRKNYLSELEITRHEMESLCKVFVLMDEDGDGVLQVNELKNLLKTLGRLDLEEDIKQLEADARSCEGKTGMNVHQFQRFLGKQLINITEAEIREAFEAFDSKPPTGKLSLPELRHWLKYKELKLTDDEIDFLFREEDYWMLEDKNAFEYEHLINKIMDKSNIHPFLNYS